ncbi:Uncharacterised protein [Vibrio cholerae]|nr:Uncharacterised protein [Vibrio cholerae]
MLITPPIDLAQCPGRRCLDGSDVRFGAYHPPR